jgi:hypothetical protein
VFLIPWIILLCLYLFLTAILIRKTSRRKRNARVVFPVRQTIKILLIISGLGMSGILALGRFPFAFGFIGSIFILTGSFEMIFGDIIVDNDGVVYLGLIFKYMPWERIKAIRNHPSYLGIIAHRRLETKQFVKFIWKIKDEDATRLQSLFLERKNLGEEMGTNACKQYVKKRG